MSSLHPESAESENRVDTCKPGEHPRPKLLSSIQPVKPAGHTLSPHRREGRAISSVLLRRVTSQEEETQARIARILRVSPEIVSRWCDPDAKQQFAVGDLVAVALAGSPTVVHAYLDELARFLFAKLTAPKSATEHALALARATGAATVALTEAEDRTARVRALRALKKATEEALADLGGER